MALGEMNSGNDIITDTGLTQEGMPADAKSVGDKINAMGPWITFGSIKNQSVGQSSGGWKTGGNTTPFFRYDTHCKTALFGSTIARMTDNGIVVVSDTPYIIGTNQSSGYISLRVPTSIASTSAELDAWLDKMDAQFAYMPNVFGE